MSIDELKTELHRKIDDISTLGELLEIAQSVDSVLSQDLSVEEKTMLQQLSKAIPDIEAGNVISHGQMQAKAKQWLHKR